ncbi:MAG: four helix bundle protein [Candidatus Moranbacteria bacterium]|jgi:four helix bundle protein|nr:four helix bundle protein [Candidatus Moranbacteria bacterium]
MLKPHNDLYGYKKLLTYKKAEELQMECSHFTHLFPFSKTLSSLADQMDRSARSGKQNIVEGWKRNTTREYFDFLGFSIGAIAELEEDCDDILRGAYPELIGIKEIMGEMGGRGETGVHSNPFNSHFPHSPASQSSNFPHFKTLSTPFTLSEVEKLRFYPLDSALPPVVRLKLRCKELNFLLKKLQDSLEQKMGNENTLSTKDKFRMIASKKREEKDAERKILEKCDMIKLENGLLMKREEWEKGGRKERLWEWK